jgi:hypothetical protein
VQPPTSPRRRRARAILATLLALVATALLAPAAGLAAKPAKPDRADAPAKKSARGHVAKRGPLAKQSSCYAPQTGDWRNIDPNTRSITRTHITFDCQDVILCDLDGNCTGGDSAYYMQVFGKCHPTDCAWGRRRAYDMGGGWIRSLYHFGWKTSHVWTKTYSYYGLTYLRVWVHNDFSAADGRTDYTTDEWFLR